MVKNKKAPKKDGKKENAGPPSKKMGGKFEAGKEEMMDKKMKKVHDKLAPSSGDSKKQPRNKGKR